MGMGKGEEVCMNSHNAYGRLARPAVVQAG